MSSGRVESLGDRIRAVFALDPEAIAVEASAGRSRWADLANAAERIEQVLQQAGIAPDVPVGWVARNRAAAIAAFAGLVRRNVHHSQAGIQKRIDHYGRPHRRI